METVPALNSTEWMKQWAIDHEHLRRNFRAYEIYGVEPYQGKEIHIDQDGFRQTYNAAISPNLKTSHIGFFGGSTTWGSYVRDNYTIPSLVSKEMASRLKTSTSVKNFAQVGFVFSQEVHEALRLIYSADSDHPVSERIVFFDGVNDVLAGIHNYTQGINHPALLPWEFQKYRYLFKLGNTGEVSWLDIFKKFKSVRLAFKALENHGWIHGEPKGVWIEPTESEMNRISDEVARDYIRLVLVAHRIFAANGIEPIFVLQPTLVEKKFPTPDEMRLLSLNKAWLPYLRTTYKQIKGYASTLLPADVRFIDMSEQFVDDKDPVFSDVLHYSELGNQKIAARLADLIVSKAVPREVAHSQ